MELFKLLGTICIDNANANKAIDDTTGKAKGSESKMTAAFKKIGTAVAAYFTVSKIVEFGKELIDLGASAEDAAAKVNTLLSPGTDTTKYFNDMLSASSATGVAMADFAEAVYSAISASVDQKDAVDFTTKAIMLSKAGFTAASTAVDVLTTAINAYGLSADDATHISDVLITTQNLGKTTVDELAQSMGKVIPLASAYNVNLENLAAGYAVMTKGGIATAESTTYMKGMLTELANTSSNVAKVLKQKTSKSFSDLMASGYSLGDVLQVLYTSAGNDSTAFANLWSSTEAGTGALALVNAGADEFNKTLDNMSNSADATSEAYKKVTGTFNQQMTRLKTNLQNVGIQIANKFLPALTGIVSSIADSVVPAFDWLSGVCSNFGKMFEGIVNDGVINWSLLGERIGGMFKNLAADIPGLLSSVGDAISNAWTNTVWPNIQGLFKAVFGVDLPDWNTVKKSISDGWNNTVWPAIQNYFKTNFGIEIPSWEDTKKAISDWWQNVWSGIKNLFKTVFTISTEDTDGLTVAEKIKVWWQKVIDAVGNLFCAVFGVDPEDKNNPITKIKNWWTDIQTSFINYFKDIFKIFTDDSTTTSEKIQKWWKTVVSLVGDIFKATFRLLAPLVEAARKAIQEWWAQVKDGLGLTVGFKLMGETAKNLVEDPVGTLQTVGSVSPAMFRKAIGTLFSTPEPKPNAAGAVFSKPTIFDTRLGRQMVGEAGAEAVAPIDVLQGYVRAAVKEENGSKDSEIAELKEIVRDLVNDLPGMMVNAFASMRFDVNNREFARMVRQVT